MGDVAPAQRAGQPDRAAHDVLPPRLGGRFRLLGVLHDAPGAVDHRAHDELLDRPALVTVAPVDVARVPLLARAAGLDHPHLVPVIDLEIDERDPAAPRAVVVTDPSGGGDLAARRESGPLDLVDALVCGAAVADALHHLHRAGLVHLAVGPATVLFDEEGRARLGHAGLALAAPGTDAATGGDAATDVADLGGLLLALLPGRGGPGHGPTPPRDVRRLLRRTTDADPASRPGADEVAATLRRAALAATAAPAAGPVSARVARVPRGVLAAAAVATAALLAGTVAAAVSSPVEEVAADGPGAAEPPALVAPADPRTAVAPDRRAAAPATTDGARTTSGGSDARDGSGRSASDDSDRSDGPRTSGTGLPADVDAMRAETPTSTATGAGTTPASTPAATPSSSPAAAPSATASSTPAAGTATPGTPPTREPEGLVGRLLGVL